MSLRRGVTDSYASVSIILHRVGRHLHGLRGSSSRGARRVKHLGHIVGRGSIRVRGLGARLTSAGTRLTITGRHVGRLRRASSSASDAPKGPRGGDDGDDVPPSRRDVTSHRRHEAGSLHGPDKGPDNKRPNRGNCALRAVTRPSMVMGRRPICYGYYNQLLVSVPYRGVHGARVISVGIIMRAYRRRCCRGIYRYNYMGGYRTPGYHVGCNSGLHTLIACLGMIRYVPVGEVTRLVSSLSDRGVDRKAIRGVLGRGDNGTSDTCRRVHGELRATSIMKTSRANTAMKGRLR